MTTPKPAEWKGELAGLFRTPAETLAASAPPADTLQAIVAEMREKAESLLGYSLSAASAEISDWCDRIEAIAASAQVREGEPWGWEFDDLAGAHHLTEGAQIPFYAHANIKPLAARPAHWDKPAAEPCDWRAHYVEVTAMRYMDNGLDRRASLAAAERDAAGLAAMTGTMAAAEPVHVVSHAVEATAVVSNDTAIHDTQAEPAPATINSSEIDSKLIGEPVPVAQGLPYAESMAKWCDKQADDPDNKEGRITLLAIAETLRGADATIADHARRDAALLADNERLRGAFDDHDEKASVHWYGEWVGAKRRADGLEVSLAAATETWTDEAGNTWSPPTAWAYAQACRAYHEAGARAEALEASLAACRANEARYLMLRNPPPKGDALCAWSTTESGVLSDRGKHDGPIDGDRLDAELDAAIARRQP